MDSQTQNLYTTAMNIAGEMDTAFMSSTNRPESVKEQLRMDLRDFLIFLIVADKTIARDEIKYINKTLGYNFDNETFKRYIVNSGVLDDDFLNNPPKSLQYFLEYSKEDFISYDSKYYDIKKLYLHLFQSMGEDFLASCRHVDHIEINQLTRYHFMLDSQIKSYQKSGGIKQNRPDRIPFKRKIQESTDETQTETTFIGSISGGDETISDLDDLLGELDSLIGLTSVKEEVRNLINLLKIIEIRQSNGLKAPPVTKHFVFTGNPGTGKTTVARLLSKIYCSLGILSKGHIVEVDRSGLVAGYMGQTAIKVKEVVDKALGGVLFIDEAYALSKETQNGDFGQEAIDTLVKAMEDNRDDLIVIVAGYPDLMEQFISANPGLKSRFQKTLHFEDYNARELYQVFNRFCKLNDYKLSSDASDYLMEQLHHYTMHKTKDFGNARDMRNFLDYAISNQANRLLTVDLSDTEALVTLTVSDLQPIFEGGH